MTEDQFWSSNPKKMHPYSQAKVMWRTEMDEISYYMGLYTMRALSVVISTALSKKGQNTLEYFEKPLLYMVEEEEGKDSEEMSEEERIKKVEEVFMMLGGQPV